MERGPLTSQRGRLVFHLDAVWSTVLAGGSAAGLLGKAANCALVFLAHAFLHGNFFFFPIFFF